MSRLVAICAVGLLLATLCVANAGETFSLKDGSVSYTMPEGWTLRERPEKEPMAVAPDVATTGLNIIISTISGTPTLAKYAETALVDFKKAYPDFKQLAKGDFTTAAGVKCVRLVIESTPKINKLHQVLFFVPVKGVARYQVTCSVLASHGDASDALFDAAIKTLIIK